MSENLIRFQDEVQVPERTEGVHVIEGGGVGERYSRCEDQPTRVCVCVCDDEKRGREERKKRNRKK